MDYYLSMVLELISGFFLLFVITKILGKTQFSQITPFDFISALILGELVGGAIYDEKVKVIQITFTLLTWGILIYVLEIITQKFKGSRKFLEGEPNIVIQKGLIKYNTLRRIKLDINTLLSLLRQKGHFSIDEIEFAIMEPSGKLSVLPKSEYDIPKMKDLNLPLSPVNLSFSMIIDGEVLYDNLKEAGLDEKWLDEQLAMQGFTSVKQVVYAEWRKNNPLTAIPYEENSK